MTSEYEDLEDQGSEVAEEEDEERDADEMGDTESEAESDEAGEEEEIKGPIPVERASQMAAQRRAAVEAAKARDEALEAAGLRYDEATKTVVSASKEPTSEEVGTQDEDEESRVASALMSIGVKPLSSIIDDYGEVLDKEAWEWIEWYAKTGLGWTDTDLAASGADRSLLAPVQAAMIVQGSTLKAKYETIAEKRAERETEAVRSRVSELVASPVFEQNADAREMMEGVIEGLLQSGAPRNEVGQFAEMLAELAHRVAGVERPTPRASDRERVLRVAQGHRTRPASTSTSPRVDTAAKGVASQFDVDAKRLAAVAERIRKERSS